VRESMVAAVATFRGSRLASAMPTVTWMAANPAASRISARATASSMVCPFGSVVTTIDADGYRIAVADELTDTLDRLDGNGGTAFDVAAVLIPPPVHMGGEELAHEITMGAVKLNPSNPAIFARLAAWAKASIRSATSCVESSLGSCRLPDRARPKGHDGKLAHCGGGLPSAVDKLDFTLLLPQCFSASVKAPSPGIWRSSSMPIPLVARRAGGMDIRSLNDNKPGGLL